MVFAPAKKLIILDADGTTIDAYDAIETAFRHHDMTLGDEESFQKRHKIFKYLGGLKEFPSNLRRNITSHSRKEIVSTLTQIYRDQAKLYPGIPEFIQGLLDAPDVIVGMVTRNITDEPLETLKQLFARYGINTHDFDFFIHVPLSEKKTTYFKQVRETFAINPACAAICGDEYKDYVAAVSTGMHPYMVSYGFENFLRLTNKYDIPEELISRTPSELKERVFNALNLSSVPKRVELAV